MFERMKAIFGIGDNAIQHRLSYVAPVGDSGYADGYDSGFPVASEGFRFRRDGNHSSIVRRSMSLYSNNPLAYAVVDVLHRNIIDETASGFHLHLPTSVKIETREEITRAWQGYMAQPISVDGCNGFEFASLVVRTVLVEGCALIIKQGGKLRCIGGASLLPSGIDATNRGVSSDNGVVFDENGTLLGYNVDVSYRPHLREYSALFYGRKARFIPADQADLVFIEAFRDGAIGSPAISRCLEDISAVDSVMQASIGIIDRTNTYVGQMQTRDASSFAFTEQQPKPLNPQKGVVSKGDSPKQAAAEAGRRLKMKIAVTPAGQEIAPIEAPKNSISPIELIERLIETIAMSTGVSVHELRGFWQGLSFSSSNNGLSTARAGLRLHQNSIAMRLIKPMFDRFIKSQYLKENPTTEYKTTQEVLQRTLFSGRQPTPTDPLKTANAHMTSIKAGIDSPQSIMRRRGEDPEKIRRELEEWGLDNQPKL